MKRILAIAVFLVFAANAHASVKLRDITQVEGIRSNQLIGYGLVVGLNGTGDKSGTEFTIQSLVNMLDRLGITVSKDQVKVKNVAAVMVTAKLPPFAKTGSRIDVAISSIGDAKSLEGGTLLLTPLSAANGDIYAVAQGPISVGGMNVSAGGAGVQRNHPTVGLIPNGGTIEQELAFAMSETNFTLSFEKYSLANVVKAKNAINNFLERPIARISSPSSISVDIPADYQPAFYDFMNAVLNIEIEPEQFAKVVVDERTGTIVMGSDVQISTVGVSHGNLTITISSDVEVSQPLPLTEGQTAVTQEQDIQVEEDPANLVVVPAGVSIADLVKALNAIGVVPRDLISILQSINAAGALHGSLEVI